MDGIKKNKYVILMIISIFAAVLSFGTLSGEVNEDLLFTDVPSGHWAEESIYRLRSLGITDGIGNNEFGLGLTIKRNELAAFLVKLMNWDLSYPDEGSFADNLDKDRWYFPYIESALDNGAIIKETQLFRGDEPITREEMAVMIVRALGYDGLSKRLSANCTSFSDVSRNEGYITLAKDFGIISGVGNDLFKPLDNAKREEAAAMIVRMYERLNAKIEDIHGFYAIKSSNQSDMIKSLNSVGFGWSRLEYNQDKVILNTTRINNNEFAIPTGFFEPMDIAKKNNTNTMMMVFARDEKVPGGVLLAEHIITEPEVREKVIDNIVEQVNLIQKDGFTAEFDGVVIDFENLRGDNSKNSFNKFLIELKEKLDKSDKRLYVALHPVMQPGHAYFDGYDFKTVGEIADKVILMAHDYYAKQLTEAEMEMGYTLTPLTPIDQIYWALKHITDKDTGVQQPDKILVQFSFDSVQWKVKNGKVINKYPYSPDYDSIRKRILADDVTIKYSDLYQNSYTDFYNDVDGTDNIIWYEDSRSIDAKLKLIKMFGLKGISLWRLGNIPDFEDTDAKKVYLDVWQQILNETKK